ncbi:MAG: protein serine/threonine phosphatase 2C family protein [Rhabdochlamydiaceae bacterium]|nr:protein serine/threonine phosphatase 2C family protein [Rhabdochlamydiaceae bacterium]
MSLEAYSASLPLNDFTPGPNKLKRYHSVCGTSHNSQLPITLTKAEESMAKRVKQAAEDHNLLPSELPIATPTRTIQKVQLSSKASSHQGKRPANEDTHIMVSTDYGDIFAVCDGHGFVSRRRLKEGLPQSGQEASQFVASSIREDLLKIIRECNFDTQRAFKIWADKVQSKIPFMMAGSTAVVGFFEKINRYFHVATIGDSEALVLRMQDGIIQPIPMSPENNWATPACVERAKQIFEPEVFDKWEQLPAKERRFPPNAGVNLACSFGDRLMTYKDKIGVSHEPDCSLLQLEKGDLILLGCDGVFDFAGIHELIDKVIEPHWNDRSANLAKLIAKYALEEKQSTDNVTVITVRVNSETAQIEIRASQASTEVEQTPPL